MPHPTTDPAPPATARQGSARQGSDPAGPWEDRWDPERGGGFAWQWDPAELARFEQWHEQTLARQLAQAAALPDPFDPFEPAFPLEPADQLEPTGPSDPFEPAVTEPDGPDEDGDAGLGPSLQDAADAVLAQIEALEADRSRLDERLLAAYAALHAVLGEQLAEPEDPAPDAAGMGLAGLGVDEVVLAEVSTATGVPHGEAARRLRLAVAPRRYARLRSRLAAGTVSLLHATMIAEALEGLAREQRLDGPALEQVAGQVTERVLAALPDGSRPTHAQVRARLTRVIRSLQDPATTRARRAAARARRGLHAQLTEDGMGVLSLHTGAEQVVAVMDRIEHLARAMRQAGDPRCLDQLRADLAAEALLRHGYGPCPTHTPTTSTSTATSTAAAATIEDASTSTDEATATDQTPASTTVQDAEVEGAIEGADTDAAAVQDGEDCETAAATEDGEATGVGGDGLAGRPCGCVPTAPPAQAWIVVPFEVATGTSHAACELPGHGWVTAEHAREIITAPGSSWRWLAVDHLSGQALTLGTDRYRPTPAITEQVRALDGHCRAPGCTIPARRCDLDHHTPYPDGPTTVANLGPLHRAHHNLKTHHLWTCTRPDPQPPEQHPDPDTTLAARTDRGLAWRTLTGRDYLTYPKSWTEALHDPTHPEHTPPTRHHPQTPTERRAHHTQQRRQHPDWNDPPPF